MQRGGPAVAPVAPGGGAGRRERERSASRESWERPMGDGGGWVRAGWLGEMERGSRLDLILLGYLG